MITPRTFVGQKYVSRHNIMRVARPPPLVLTRVHVALFGVANIPVALLVLLGAPDFLARNGDVGPIMSNRQ